MLFLLVQVAPTSGTADQATQRREASDPERNITMRLSGCMVHRLDNVKKKKGFPRGFQVYFWIQFFLMQGVLTLTSVLLLRQL
jgi:hypothetical protein